ncbi:MAG TPA: sodium:solute symporter [Candidatus Brocadiia bacterium]|nr:sodium:solute symporter [Candidatus Brocadiia bacterium]
MNLSSIDMAVLLVYFAGLTALGVWCARRTKTSDQFMAAGRSMPGWALALTLFGSFVSSISFLAQPGKSYADNWNPFVFCIALPFAAIVGAFIFVPFYRRTGEVSAYSHLEHRFGSWARTYATACFILLQLTRTGVVTFLLSMALAPAFGMDPTKDTGGLIAIIVAVGIVMTIFPLIGGTDAAIWTGAAQSLVLATGMIVSLIMVFVKMPGGAGKVFEVAAQHNKFSLGSGEIDFAKSTILVVFLYALSENLKNFGVDQKYVQLYATAKTDKDARSSVWAGALMYIPLAAMTFMIGTALFAFYSVQPGLLPEGIKSDKVFPHFIYTQLPAGIKGLVVAAICAAATDSSFNCISTLFHCDVYKRYFRPKVSERESLLVLRVTTIACGVLSVAISMAMIRVKTILDAWWTLAGIMAGGMLGLFLLGIISRRAGNKAAIAGVTVGTAAIIWMSLSLESFWGAIRAFAPEAKSPEWFQPYRFPWHDFMIPVVGTALIIAVGLLVGLISPRQESVAQK